MRTNNTNELNANCRFGFEDVFPFTEGHLSAMEELIQFMER